MIYQKTRKAIAMLELIFAIVIMGIVFMSAPMLVSQASKASLMGTQQEAIAALSTDIGMILTHHWDANDTNESLSSPILVTDSTSVLLNELNTSGVSMGIRAGTPILSNRSFLSSVGGRLLATPKDNFVDGNFDDIDDYDGKVDRLINTITTSVDTGDYIDKQMKFTTTVSYISDTPTSGGYNTASVGLDNPFGTGAVGGTSHIKMISITATTDNEATELQKQITLRAFSCNIGSYTLAERTFP